MLVYQWTSGTVPTAIIPRSELVRADQATREVETWMRNSQTGPGGWNRLTSWKPRQHWDRLKSLSVMAPERIKQLLDLWPEIEERWPERVESLMARWMPEQQSLTTGPEGPSLEVGFQAKKGRTDDPGTDTSGQQSQQRQHRIGR